MGVMENDSFYFSLNYLRENGLISVINNNNNNKITVALGVIVMFFVNGVF